MQKLLLTAVAGVALLLTQPSSAQAQRWVPGNPNFPLNPQGLSYGSGTPLPFTVPFSGFNSILYWDGRYDAVTGFYVGMVSGWNSKIGHYSGTVVARTTPTGTWYKFTPHPASADKFRNTAFLINRNRIRASPTPSP